MQQPDYFLDNWRKKFLYSLGLLIAITYAIFCGLSLAGYVVLTFGTGGGALLLAGIGALVCSIANFKTSITKIPEILVDFFGRKQFFDGFFSYKNKTEYQDYQRKVRYLPWHRCILPWFSFHAKRIGLVVGVVLSFVAGAAIFGQGYGGITSALMAFAGLTAASSGVIGVGIFGAAIFFFAFWAITLKAIILELQKQGWFSQFKQFFRDLFKVPEHKSKTRAYIEGGIIVFLLLVAAPLAIIGVVTAMMASQMGIMRFVTDNWSTVSDATLKFIQGVSWFLVVGLASLGQLPFYLKTTMKTVKRIAQWAIGKFGKQPAGADVEPTISFTFGEKLMYIIRLMNAGFSALYSYVGGGGNHSFLADSGAAGGVLNSFSAPEKIGGTGLSDIWHNFKGRPGTEHAGKKHQRPRWTPPVSGGVGPEPAYATTSFASRYSNSAALLQGRQRSDYGSTEPMAEEEQQLSPQY